MLLRSSCCSLSRLSVGRKTLISSSLEMDSGMSQQYTSSNSLTSYSNRRYRSDWRKSSSHGSQLPPVGQQLHNHNVSHVQLHRRKGRE